MEKTRQPQSGIYLCHSTRRQSEQERKRAIQPTSESNHYVLFFLRGGGVAFYTSNLQTRTDKRRFRVGAQLHWGIVYP